MDKVEKTLNEEVLFMRQEIANEWHINNVLRLPNAEHIFFAKMAFMFMPCDQRKGRLSADILLQNYLMKNESDTK